MAEPNQTNTHEGVPVSAWASLRLGGAITNLAQDTERRQRAVRVFRAAVLMMLVFGVGTYGYWYLTDGAHSTIECLYMTVITVSTVGFEEVIPAHNDALKLFTMGLLLLGGGSILYFLTAVASVVVEGDLMYRFWRRRVATRLRRLQDHVVLVGLGPIGREALAELWAEEVPLVVLTDDMLALEDAVRTFGDGLLFIQGDPLDDMNLSAARIERARAVVVALGEDRESLFACVNAKQLTDDPRVVVKVTHAANTSKFERVGAHARISPAFEGGRRLAFELLRPWRLSFTDVMLDADPRLELGTVTISQGAALASKRLDEVDVVGQTGCLIMGHSPAAGDFMNFDYGPDNTTQLTPGSRLVALGRPEQLRELRRWCKRPESRRRCPQPERERPPVPNPHQRIIVIGVGEVGEHVVAELLNMGASRLCVVDSDEQRLAHLAELSDRVTTIAGDALEDAVLQEAGLESAAGVVVAMPRDQDNLFICLTARQLNPEIRIVSRLADVGNSRKFRFIGAHSTVSVPQVGGARLAHAVLRPRLLSFASDLIASEDAGARLRELTIAPGCPTAGLTLGDAGLRERTNAIILGLRRRKGSRRLTYRPDLDLRLRPGASLVALGDEDALDSLAELLAEPTTPDPQPRRTLAGAFDWLGGLLAGRRSS